MKITTIKTTAPTKTETIKMTPLLASLLGDMQPIGITRACEIATGI